MKAGFASLGSVRTQAIVLLVLAFLAGAFAGGAIERIGSRRMRAALGMRPPRGGPGFPGSRSGRSGFPSMLERVGLSTDQRARIDTIVKKRSARTDSLMKMSRAAYDSTRKEIDEVLTAEQRQKVDSMRAARGRAFGGPGSRGGRGGGPPQDAKSP
jgi:Spy/CpxP family protein refolding chaperone